MRIPTVFLSIFAAIALDSFCEGNPIYYFDKKKPFIFGKKTTSTDGLSCKVATPDSLYNPPSRIKSYLGEGTWSAIHGDSTFQIIYSGIENRQIGFMKELVRFHSENWFLIGKNDSCWMEDVNPTIFKNRLEF